MRSSRATNDARVSTARNVMVLLCLRTKNKQQKTRPSDRDEARTCTPRYHPDCQTPTARPLVGANTPCPAFGGLPVGLHTAHGAAWASCSEGISCGTIAVAHTLPTVADRLNIPSTCLRQRTSSIPQICTYGNHSWERYCVCPPNSAILYVCTRRCRRGAYVHRME